MIQGRTSFTSGLLLLASTCIGCSNEPGALAMQAAPTKAEFDTNEPLAVSITLCASDRPVCLSKGKEFRYQVRNARSGQIVRSDMDNVDVFCGTGILESLIFFPYLYIGAWLDVADVANRFDVLESHEVRRQIVSVTRNDSGNSISRVPLEDNEPTYWPPGDYDVTIKLNNRRGFCSDFLPLPIGWQLYNQPTEATVRVVVKDRVSSTSRPTN